MSDNPIARDRREGMTLKEALEYEKEIYKRLKAEKEQALIDEAARWACADCAEKDAELERLRAALRSVRDVLTRGKVFRIKALVSEIDEALGEDKQDAR